MEETEVVTPETLDGNEGESVIEEYDDTEVKLKKSHEYGENQKIRAEKAERELKEKNARLAELEKTQEVPTGLGLKDMLAIHRQNIHEDDLERVQKFAQLEGVSVAEALQNEELRAILSVRQEKRKSAEVTNITTRRTTGKVSDDAFLAKVSKGELPEPGSEEAIRLYNLRRGIK